MIQEVVKMFNLCMIRVPEEEVSESGLEVIFEEMLVNKLPKYIKTSNHRFKKIYKVQVE